MPDEGTNQVSDDDVRDVRRRFRYLARMRKHFWRRWRKEYLTNLREFHKVKKGKQSVGAKVGDVVLVIDENLKRGCWSVGRIEGLVMGRDSVARGAKVKVVNKGRTSFINRPVQKLYPLELDTRVSIPAEVDEEISERCDVDERKEESIKNDKVSMAGSSREKVSIEGSSRRPRRAAAQVARWRTGFV